MANLVKTVLFFSIFQCLIALNYGQSSSSENQPTFFCTDMNPQNNIDLEQIMGMWFGSEILTHHDSEEGVFYYESCVVIHIADITEQKSAENQQIYGKDYGEHHGSHDNRKYSSHNRNSNMRYLRLIWDESESNIEYTLRYNNSRPGFWISSGPQKLTLADFRYNQFSGTVQVMKAVGNHLVLTFCNNTAGSQLFTVVLGRRPNSLTYEDIQSIRNLLKHRGLSTSSIRKVCTSGAKGLTSVLMLLVFIVLKSVNFF